MLTYRFDNENDISATVNALRVAAERFDHDAKVCNEENQPRLAEQFVHQATQARRIADDIEMLA